MCAGDYVSTSRPSRLQQHVHMAHSPEHTIITPYTLSAYMCTHENAQGYGRTHQHRNVCAHSGATWQRCVSSLNT